MSSGGVMPPFFFDKKKEYNIVLKNFFYKFALPKSRGIVEVL